MKTEKEIRECIQISERIIENLNPSEEDNTKIISGLQDEIKTLKWVLEDSV